MGFKISKKFVAIEAEIFTRHKLLSVIHSTICDRFEKKTNLLILCCNCIPHAPPHTSMLQFRIRNIVFYIKRKIVMSLMFFKNIRKLNKLNQKLNFSMEVASQGAWTTSIATPYQHVWKIMQTLCNSEFRKD